MTSLLSDLKPEAWSLEPLPEVKATLLRFAGVQFAVVFVVAMFVSGITSNAKRTRNRVFDGLIGTLFSMFLVLTTDVSTLSLFKHAIYRSTAATTLHDVLGIVTLRFMGYQLVVLFLQVVFISAFLTEMRDWQSRLSHGARAAALLSGCMIVIDLLTMTFFSSVIGVTG